MLVTDDSFIKDLTGGFDSTFLEKDDSCKHQYYEIKGLTVLSMCSYLFNALPSDKLMKAY